LNVGASLWMEPKNRPESRRPKTGSHVKPARQFLEDDSQGILHKVGTTGKAGRE